MSKKDLKPEDCAFDDISHYGALNNELTVLADSFKRMITDVRAVEEEKTALIEKLKNSSMNAARLAAMGQMTATVVHDIKNPLGVIGGNIFLLKKSLSSGTVEREKIEIVLDKIEMSVHKINQIVTSVMNQSRDAKNDPFEQLPEVKIFSELMVLSEERFNRHGVKLMVMMPPEDLIISCRPVEISRVLVNLVNNALDAVKEQDGSWVKVSADQDGRYCKIYVTDCGYGIEKSVVDQMFEPFFTTKSRLMGTGLGLYISEQLIKNNQGTLRIDDKNPNTCFVITLSLLPLELKDTIA